MNIFLTGSGGFIGKNLKKYFEQKGYKIFAPRSFELDLRNELEVENYFNKKEFDSIIHCASTGGYNKNIDKTVENNLSMVDNLLKYKNTNAKLILFGSGAMYDKTRGLHKVKESEIGDFIPEDLYGKSKLDISNRIKNLSDVLCLNIFGCYGYDEKENRFPTYAIKQALNNQPIEINQNVIFDYLFIEDLCNIVEYFMNNDFKENIINVTPTESITLLEIANIVNSFVKQPVEIKILSNSMNKEYTGDNSLLLKNYPKLKFTAIDIGLKKLYEYIR